jgi:predicted TIM-barrel fold metal-dependent hydrolase
MLATHEACGVTRALVNPSDSPSAGHRYLDDPVCGPLLAAAEALGRPLFMHPSRDLPAGEHYDDFVMSLIVGRPSHTAVCAARPIFTGTLDRYPGLSLLLAHGGNVWSLPALRLLVEVLGPDRILVGNDQPPVWFPLAESLALLGQLDLPAAEREAARWRNASRLFGLEPARLGV